MKLADTSAARLKSANTDGWAEAFRQALCIRKVDVVPDGFFMTQQWAEIVSKSESHTRRMLLAGVKDGKVEQKDFRVQVGRIIRTQTHYRLRVRT